MAALRITSRLTSPSTAHRHLTSSLSARRHTHSSIQKAPHLDFRAFTDQLRLDNDIADITAAASPHLEIAATIRRAYETKSKAPLFHNVTGTHTSGLFRILGAQGGLSSDPAYPYRRLARHLGLPATASIRDVINHMLSAKTRAPIPPKRVATGPCKDFVIKGEDVDLTALPAPLLNRADGGKYIQTLGVNIVPAPDGKWTNWSIARAMVLGKNTLVGLIMKPQHIAQIFAAWKKEGQVREIPYAIALGAPPVAVMAASMPLPKGVSEGAYVGSLCGEGLEVVQCETNEMWVPANSEIVLEGRISVGERAREGPFGEMHGYSFLDESLLQPVYRVDAITFRENPILPVCVPGRATGPDETHTMIGTLAAAEIKWLLQQEGLPVLDVFTPFESQVIWAAVQVDRKELAKLKTNATEFCNRIGNLVFRHKCGMQIHRLLVVGDDVDPFKFEDVTWAFASRCRPRIDEFYFEDVPAYPLVPYMSHGISTKLTGGKVVGNCLLPEEYKGEQGWVTCDFENGYPEDVKKRVLDRWTEFGL